MSLKLFGQLVLIGGQVVGKIISGAYKQAIANAAKNPNVAKGASGPAGGTGMNVDEAAKILNCSRNPSREELAKNFEHLFRINDRTKGGSFYLQSKIVRAREALETQLSQKQQ